MRRDIDPEFWRALPCYNMFLAARLSFIVPLPADTLRHGLVGGQGGSTPHAATPSTTCAQSARMRALIPRPPSAPPLAPPRKRCPIHAVQFDSGRRSMVMDGGQNEDLDTALKNYVQLQQAMDDMCVVSRCPQMFLFLLLLLRAGVGVSRVSACMPADVGLLLSVSDS